MTWLDTLLVAIGTWLVLALVLWPVWWALLLWRGDLEDDGP